jgi:hypothetical protein
MVLEPRGSAVRARSTIKTSSVLASNNFEDAVADGDAFVDPGPVAIAVF